MAAVLSVGVTLCVQVIILIGNKADLEAQRDVTYEEAKQFAEENGKERVCGVCVVWGVVCVRVNIK